MDEHLPIDAPTDEQLDLEESSVESPPLPPEVEAKAREVEGVVNVDLDLVWEPPWDMEMMSPAARLDLNM